MVQMGMRTVLVSGLAAALLITLCAPIPASATPEATTIYVGDEVAVGAGGNCASPDLSTLGEDDNVALQSAITLVGEFEDDALDTVYICNGTYDLVASLTAEGTANMVGESAAGSILHGGDSVQILQMTTGSVAHLTFTSAFTAVEDGGAIRASGALDVQDSVFTNNATNRFGGAIAAFGVLTISGSSFDENHAMFDGGAVWGLTVNVSDSTFTGNYVGSLGGAIFTSVTVSVEDTDFTENSADFGGALYSYDQVSVLGGTLTDNQALGDGGAIWGSLVSIETALLQGNCAASGGAVFANSIVYLTSSVVSGNCGGSMEYEVEVEINGSGTVLNDQSLPDCTAGVCTLDFSAVAVLTGDPSSVEWSATVLGSLHQALCVDETCRFTRAVETPVIIDLSTTFDEEDSYQITATFPGYTAYAVTVAIGSGLGTVSDGGSLICTETSSPFCEVLYESGTDVVLTAEPSPGYVLSGWSGASSASCAGNVCTFTDLQEDVAVTANFDEATTQYAVTVSVGSGEGAVSDGGLLYCDETSPSSCEVLYEAGSDVVLTADPAPGFSVFFWSVSSGEMCMGSECTLMDLQEDTLVEANFLKDPIIVDPGGDKRHLLKVRTPSTGSVQVLDLFSGDLRECRSTDELCRWAIRSGRLLLLTIAEAEGDIRTTWSGCTSADAASCNISLTGDHSVVVQIRQRLTSWFKRGQAVFRESAAADLRAMASALQGRNEQDQVLIKGFAKYRLSLARDRARMLRRTLRDLGVGGRFGFEYAIAAPDKRKARAIVAIQWADRA